MPQEKEKEQKEAEDRKEEDEDDGEPDEWDQRIEATGCADENFALLMCHADTKDWRQCGAEMAAFKQCWEAHQNNTRTSTKDLDPAEVAARLHPTEKTEK